MIPLTALTGQTVAIMGLGASGLATAAALSASGAHAVCWDDSADRRARAQDHGLTLRDIRTPDAYDNVDLLILSPGVPYLYPEPHPSVTAARQAGVPIRGDLSLLTEACPDACYVGITGTNGKSTVTDLIGFILGQAGARAQVGGNLGPCALALTPYGADGIFVLETSSYQLDLDALRFNVAVLLNIGVDHLDRHGGMDGYIRAKTRIFERQQAGDVAVIGLDDPYCARIAQTLDATAGRRVIGVSGARVIRGGVGADGARLIDDAAGARETVIDLGETPALQGAHNVQNMAAAWAVTVHGLQTDPETARRALRAYTGLPHRQEMVADIDGVRFINDSKATNAHAAAYALAQHRDIYWIAGGLEKQGGYEALSPFLDRVRHAFLIGQDAPGLAAFLEGQVPMTRSGLLQAAVEQALHQARTEQAHRPVVLLSPACASFDQFLNFEARGEVFRACVRALNAAANPAS